jgi:hypothetical protein
MLTVYGAYVTEFLSIGAASSKSVVCATSQCASSCSQSQMSTDRLRKPEIDERNRFHVSSGSILDIERSQTVSGGSNEIWTTSQ